MNKSLFRWRVFVVMLMVIGFAVIVLSGVILYAAPHGRASREWQALFLSKREWQDVHIVFGLLFAIAGLVHIWLNWKPLLGYLRPRLLERLKGKTLNIFRLEPLAALLFCGFLFAASLVPFPPASTLLEWRESVANLFMPGANTP